MSSIASAPSSRTLRDHTVSLRGFSLRDALQDQARQKNLCLSTRAMFVDFSKHLVTTETIKLLCDLGRECGVEDLRERMFQGEHINLTEDRAVLHTALRSPQGEKILLDGLDIAPDIQTALASMKTFSDEIRGGTYKGFTGKSITDIVSIGIGGSDLGPRFVTEALRHLSGPLKLHFVSNVDGQAMSSVLREIRPETTLFLIASKTFTTEETLLNARTARQWFHEAGGDDSGFKRHFVGIAANQEEVKKFGINQVFPFWDWVGGRYSLWSAIGLPIMLAVGAENFLSLLAGARSMDTHFRTTPLERNIPFLMGMLGVWYRNFWNYPVHLILPYDQRLQKLPKYIQQMDMESNGKGVDRDGQKVSYDTGPIIFGEAGTDSQHSFMQLVHQGTTVIPIDFIACAHPDHTLPEHHRSLLANCLAQSRALAIGMTPEEAGHDPFQTFSGNRPSTTILLDRLTPFALGELIAAYEHKVFVQGVAWNLNSFDQPGVQLGKKLAKGVTARLKNDTQTDPLDVSSEALLAYIKS